MAESVAISYSINDIAISAADTPAIATVVTPLLSLGLISVVASRGKIRLKVSIGDFQEPVFSSSEGCSTL